MTVDFDAEHFLVDPKELDHLLSYCWWPGKGVAMPKKRQQHSPAFKAQVALAAVVGDRTVNELTGQFGAYPTLIHAWKKQLLAEGEVVFTNGANTPATDGEAEKSVPCTLAASCRGAAHGLAGRRFPKTTATWPTAEVRAMIAWRAR